MQKYQILIKDGSVDYVAWINLDEIEAESKDDALMKASAIYKEKVIKVELMEEVK